MVAVTFNNSWPSDNYKHLNQMKKLLFILLISASSIQLKAESNENIKGNGKITEQERSISSFNEIAAAGSVDIIITQGQNEGVVVITDKNIQQYVITEIIDNTLKIRIKENANISPSKLKVKVNCKQLISIKAGGSGDIQTDGSLKSDALQISQGGSGDFKLDLDLSKLTITKAGSGDFILTGKTDSFTISSAGSGDIRAAKMKVNNCKISLVGSGDVWLAKGTKASLSNVGSGEVHYE